MHGYEPPKHTEQGSWGDIASLIGAVFATLAGPLLAIVLVLGLSLAALLTLFSNPPMALIPIAGLVLIVLYFLRRDERAQKELERDVRDIRGDR